VAIENVKTMEELRDASISPQRFVARMLTGLALIAGLLAAVGVYDVMAHSVASRRREIAIRISIGAKPRDVLAAVLRDAVRLTIAGLVMGMIAAVILGRILQGLVFGAETFDPLTYGVVLTVATALAVLASWIPARRAIHTAPMTVLRGE
jgi:ABC-type antimicrobial peptide transport system permease subunit